MYVSYQYAKLSHLAVRMPLLQTNTAESDGVRSSLCSARTSRVYDIRADNQKPDDH